MSEKHLFQSPYWTRRQFLGTSVMAGLALPFNLIAHPYRPYFSRNRTGISAPVRVRGVVRSGGKGIPGVAVSDGFDVVQTGADGSYQLVANPGSQFVRMSLPSGYRIPVNPTGTSRLYAPLGAADTDEQSISFDLETDRAASDDFSFLVLADPQTQTDWEMNRFHRETAEDVVSVAAGLSAPAAFGLSCGDIMFDHLDLYPAYKEAVHRMGLPFFQVIGNHDLDTSASSDADSGETFSSRFGPAYYSFNRGEIHFVVLDDVFWYGTGYIGHIDADQLRWLEQDLALVEPGRTVVVLTHIPGHSGGTKRAGLPASRGISNSVTNRKALYRLLEPFNAHLITGHTHESEHVFDGGVHEHVLGTACGAWWSGDICYDGTPNGYAVFEARGSSLSWQYKATGRPFDYQLRVYPTGTAPESPNTLIANVWDWDPEWKIEWFEDGARMGAMERRTGLDPLAIARYAGPNLPTHRTWVDPVRTDHLFYAAVENTNAALRVVATDRFGRTYSASPEAL